MAQCTVKLQNSQDVDYITFVILDNAIIEKFGIFINKFLQKIDSQIADFTLMKFVLEEASIIENILEILIDILSFDIKPQFEQTLINWNIYPRVHTLIDFTVKIIQQFDHLQIE